MKEASRKDWIRWSLQILLWGGFWLVAPLLMNESSVGNNFIYRNALLAIMTGALVAVNLAVLFPQLYLKRNAVLFFVLGVVVSVLFVQLTEWVSDFLTLNPNRPTKRPDQGNRPDPGYYRNIFRSFPYLIAFLGSSAIEITVNAQRQARAAIHLQKEKLESEVKWLRWQTNPHFLFNALNNIYALTIMKSDQAPEHLMQLSEMLRYMLYEGNHDKVPIDKEIEYLKKYVSLQQLKDSQGLNVSMDIAPISGNPMIVPQLLIPFVENAFKHSNVEDRANGWINISLSQQDNVLRFVVENSIPSTPYTKDAHGGLGLQSVKRLLDLTYPNAHRLDIQSTANTYRICLDLTLT
ncbi:MAG: histidine kinase [Bacteroidia bacterium]|nr:histidine kinase [Bacteroidia bacterium]